ncbi:MAG: hypothetical protein AB1333_04395 [Patescibacteria group bacterium]
MSEEKEKPISKHDFYFEVPLYELIEYFQLEDSDNLFNGDVDAYSAKNNTDTTYRIDFDWVKKTEEKISGNRYLISGFCIVTLTCKRKNNDILRFFVYNDEFNRRLMKVGQFPSIADLQFADIGKKYDKILSSQNLHDLKKAIGLMAHGAGAGSLVYLRRIFENIILDTYRNNKNTLDVKDEEFQRKRMDEKVNILKELLPSQLVEMKGIYGILSKGVHELSEKECLTYFPALKLSIILILDQKIKEDIERTKDVETKNAIAEITRQINGK